MYLLLSIIRYPAACRLVPLGSLVLLLIVKLPAAFHPLISVEYRCLVRASVKLHPYFLRISPVFLRVRLLVPYFCPILPYFMAFRVQIWLGCRACWNHPPTLPPHYAPPTYVGWRLFGLAGSRILSFKLCCFPPRRGSPFGVPYASLKIF